MFYITGDTHRDFRKVAAFCDTTETTIEDILIILGDAGINYFGKPKDDVLKQQLSELPITLLCVYGNHEQRPTRFPTYEETEWRGGVVYKEAEFPTLLFAKDGEIYELDGKRCIIIGGANSVDKSLRIKNDWGWWPDEQPSPEIKSYVEQRLEKENWSVDMVFSHTCPMKYLPREVFLAGINPSDEDYSTEEWLDIIEDKLNYSLWFCGHYHTYKVIDKMRFLFNDYLVIR